MSGRDAAIAAGFSEKTATKQAHRLEHENQLVMAELEKQRLALRKRTGYDADAAVTEFDTAIADARKANQYNAVMKGIEMKCRIHGLIREKVDLSVTEQMDIQGTLAEARSRLRPLGATDVVPRYPAQLPPPIAIDIFS